MAAVLWTVVAVLLGFLFVFAGTNKITGQVFPDIHKQMITNFDSFSELWEVRKYGIDSTTFRQFIGWTEVVCGVFLFLPIAILSRLATLVLILVMIGATASHHLKHESIIPPVVIGILLLLLLLFRYTSSYSRVSTESQRQQAKKKASKSQ